VNCYCYILRKGQLSQYGVGIRAGRRGVDYHYGQEMFLFSTASRPAQEPPIALSNWYRVLFPLQLSGLGMKFTTHLHLVLSSRLVELYLHFPTFVRGVVILHV
jgi:hypothetical protein